MSYTLNPSNATTTLTWTSDDSKIASVSSSGVVTGVKAGSTYINVRTANGKTAYCKVTVESATVEPTSISLPSSKTIQVGESFTMSYTLNPSNATTTLTWSSDDSKIASVSSSGVVTGVKAGSTYINVRTANGKADYCKVTVESAANPKYVGVEDAFAYGFHSFVIKSDGTLWASGNNDYGQLGNGSSSQCNTFKKVMNDVVDVKGSYDHTLVIKKDNTAWIFGRNEEGQFGDGTYKDCSIPAKVMDDVVSAEVYYKSTYFIKKDRSLWGCGRNGEYGVLGLGSLPNTSTPRKIMDNVSTFLPQLFNLTILQEDGRLWRCGANWAGQVGDGTTTTHTTPVIIGDGFLEIFGGDTDVFAIKEDRSLWGCGCNYYGELGDGSTNNRTTLTKIMDDVLCVHTTSSSSFFIKSDGSLYVCGYNHYGEIGDGTYNQRIIPIKIMDDVKSVTGDISTYILKKDGSLWTCGYNGHGQLGNGTFTDILTPTKIMDDVKSVSLNDEGGYVHCLIVKNDGSLWACGLNDHGQLGDGTTTDRATPVMIMAGDPSYTGIQDIVISADEMAAIKAKKGVFSISGQRLSAPQRGINIINGKKVIIK